MKILLLSIGYPPQSIGGTEIYTQALARELHKSGHEVNVVIPSINFREKMDDEIAINEVPLQTFDHYLAENTFDIIHAHPLTTAVLDYLICSQRHHIPLVVTYHTPTLSCVRGDLILNSYDVCNGEIIQQRCTSCLLKLKGMPLIAGKAIAMFPPEMYAFSKNLPPGKVKSLFTIPDHIQKFKQSWQQLAEITQHWVAVSKWVKSVLEINGIPANKITLCRQANCHSNIVHKNDHGLTRVVTRDHLKIGYLGRIHPDKGLHILLKAMQYLPKEKFRLFIAGDTANIPNKYQQLLDELSQHDQRITWLGKVEPLKIPEFMAKIDVLVIPSLWMESGPMTILEAWEAGKPIIGSDRGGIREWIHDYGGGMLFPAGDARALADLLIEHMKKPVTIDIPANEQLPTMQSVAQSMINIYQNLAHSAVGN